ncbi:speckle-type POZ protein-like [Copidosoma floridanum]|uniref:speckle-type POZ protein-like n=1 Tax=Copidosoma floridanum TaxID=29053 RepID=UPI000C6F67D8|nr:speckle-type POZ protein-like [Copidosoma floridanum]
MSITPQVGVTNLEVIKTNFVWTVYNFSNLRRPGAYISSPEFTEPKTQTKWCLNFCPCEIVNPNAAGLYLFLKHSRSMMSVKFQFFLLNENKGVAYTGYMSEVDFVNGASIGFNNFIGRNQLYDPALRLVVNDSLTVLCDLKLTISSVDIITSPQYNLTPKNKYDSKDSVVDDYHSLWQNGTYSDITLVINGKSFPAHKSILATRCTFFKNLFEKHAADGNNLHVLEINDFDTKTMVEVLRFIYSGKVENIYLHAKNLTNAAEKYNLSELKQICQGGSVSTRYVKKNLKINSDAVESFPSKAAMREVKEIDTSRFDTSSPDMLTKIFDEMVEISNSVNTSTTLSDSSFNTSSLSSSSTKSYWQSKSKVKTFDFSISLIIEQQLTNLKVIETGLEFQHDQVTESDRDHNAKLAKNTDEGAKIRMKRFSDDK